MVFTNQLQEVLHATLVPQAHITISQEHLRAHCAHLERSALELRQAAITACLVLILLELELSDVMPAPLALTCPTLVRRLAFRALLEHFRALDRILARRVLQVLQPQPSAPPLAQVAVLGISLLVLATLCALSVSLVPSRWKPVALLVIAALMDFTLKTMPPLHVRLVLLALHFRVLVLCSAIFVCLGIMQPIQPQPVALLVPLVLLSTLLGQLVVLTVLLANSAPPQPVPLVRIAQLATMLLTLNQRCATSVLQATMLPALGLLFVTSVRQAASSLARELPAAMIVP